MAAIASLPIPAPQLRHASRPAPPRALAPAPEHDRAPWAGARALLTAALVAVALLAAASLAVSPPVSATGAPALAGTHVAAEGESMWSIARDHAPAGEAAGYVERLVQVNGGAEVSAGQVVTLPVP